MDTGESDFGDVGGHSGHDGAFDLGVGFGSHCGHGFGHHEVTPSLTGGTPILSQSESQRDFSAMVRVHALTDIAGLMADATAASGLVERVTEQGGENKIALVKQGIVPVKGPVGVVVLPQGSAAKDQGTTTLWRNFYSVGSRGVLGFITRQKPTIEKGVTMRVRVSVVQWYVARYEACETHVVASVLTPRAVYCHASKQYAHGADELNAHLRAAQNLVERVARALAENKASEYSLALAAGNL